MKRCGVLNYPIQQTSLPQRQEEQGGNPCSQRGDARVGSFDVYVGVVGVSMLTFEVQILIYQPHDGGGGSGDDGVENAWHLQPVSLPLMLYAMQPYAHAREGSTRAPFGYF